MGWRFGIGNYIESIENGRRIERCVECLGLIGGLECKCR